MSGIAGWIDLQSNSADEPALTRMTDAIAHRGPDGAGIYHAGTRDNRYVVALGHRHLAGVDPESGVQPMFSRDGRVALVFTGKIYNYNSMREELLAQGYVFSTKSDTEVVVKAWRAWGIDCLRHLHGTFGFALWDVERELLFIARDRFGEKPLYFHENTGRILFASEIKSILAYPGIVAKQDRQSALDYLRYRYVPAPATMFEGIKKIMPGSYALWQNGNMTQTVFARPPDGNAPPPLTKTARENPVQAFTDALDQSVRLRMTPNVPLGAFLSGSIDSSSIVALMSRHSQAPINTFSVAFKDTPLDEITRTEQVARKFGTNHHEWRIEADDVIKLLPECIRFHDAPMAEAADVVIMILSRMAAQSVKVVLTGEGANEILAGYPKYKYEKMVTLYQKFIPSFLHDRIIAPLIDALPSSAVHARKLVHSFGLRDVQERLPRWFGALDSEERAALVAPDLPPRPISDFAFAVNDDVSPLRRCLFFDQASWLPDNLLERGDHMTMAVSIEARMPFVDYELATFISSLPDSFRIRGRTQKWLLHEAMRGILPYEILERPNVSFAAPVGLWFRTTLKDYVYENLLSSSSHTRDFYRRDALNNIIEQHMSGQADHQDLIWSLLSFEIFQKEYGVSC